MLRDPVLPTDRGSLSYTASEMDEYLRRRHDNIVPYLSARRAWSVGIKIWRENVYVLCSQVFDARPVRNKDRSPPRISLLCRHIVTHTTLNSPVSYCADFVSLLRTTQYTPSYATGENLPTIS